jgi:hypothetical protein
MLTFVIVAFLAFAFLGGCTLLNSGRISREEERREWMAEHLIDTTATTGRKIAP